MQVKPLNFESERSSTKCNLKGPTAINCIILLNNEYSERFCVYKVDKNSSFLIATAIQLFPATFAILARELSVTWKPLSH